MRSLFINPVLNKEFKLRFRSLKTYIGLLVYLLAMGGVVAIIMLVTTLSDHGQFFRPDQSRLMFIALSFLQLALILFITPGLTAGVISGERERQTLNILLTTEQSSASIILSKLFSSVSYLLLMVAASLPLYSMVFLFGGVSPITVLQVIGFYLFTILSFGSLGVLFSTLFRRTIISMITSYGTILFLGGGMGVLFLVLFGYFQMKMHSMTGTSQYILPYFIGMLNPPTVFLSVMGGHDTVNSLQELTGIKFPLIWSYLISYTVISALSLWISIRRLRPNMKPRRIKG